MLKTLLSIVQEVSGAQNLKGALDTVVVRVRESLEVQACAIFLFDKVNAEHVLVAADGLNKEAINKVKIKENQGLIGLVKRREEPINLADATIHPQFLPFTEAGEERYRAFLGVPIIDQRKVLGVLIIQRQQAQRFDETEEAVMVTLSLQLAALIARAETKGTTPLQLLTDAAGTLLKGKILGGVSGSLGIATGIGVVVYPLADLDVVPDRPSQNIYAEIANFKQALSNVRDDVAASSKRLKELLPPSEHALFDAYTRMLEDPTLAEEVISKIEQGQWAQGALKNVILGHIRHLSALDDNYLRDRASDIRDLGTRILASLQETSGGRYRYPEKTILVSNEVTASYLADIPTECLAGIVSFSGSSTSHVAILARALGIPTVMGVAGAQAMQLEGQSIIVDGYHGQVFINPQKSLKARLKMMLAGEEKLDVELAKLSDLPAITQDGYGLQLCVNTGFGVDAAHLLNARADAVGLYRTEEHFMLLERFPAEEEQRIIYRQLLSVFSPKSVVMRTLDIGGDKTLPYFPFEENNPSLGWRGIRITLDHPELLLLQLRAMLKASSGFSNLKIIFPMINGITELLEAKSLFRQALQEVIDEGAKITTPEIGVMIEIPSAVYQARELAKRVDFLSVGSNDLTQYLLAVDRSNPRVANLYDPFHPAVLQALSAVVQAGHAEGKKVGICGELAGDPLATILLLGMKFDSLSMSASSLNRVKQIIRNFKFSDAEQIVEEALGMDNPTVIRFYLEQTLEQAGLWELIRPSTMRRYRH